MFPGGTQPTGAIRLQERVQRAQVSNVRIPHGCERACVLSCFGGAHSRHAGRQTGVEEEVSERSHLHEMDGGGAQQVCHGLFAVSLEEKEEAPSSLMMTTWSSCACGGPGLAATQPLLW